MRSRTFKKRKGIILLKLFLRTPENHFKSFHSCPAFHSDVISLCCSMSLYSTSLTLLIHFTFLLPITMLHSAKALNFLALHEIATRPKLPFIDLLTPEGRRRRDRRIPRVSLLDYSDSAFKKLLDSGNDQSSLNACGHDHGSFQSLLEIFQPVCDRHCLDETAGFTSLAPLTTTGKRKGRPRHLNAARCRMK